MFDYDDEFIKRLRDRFGIPEDYYLYRRHFPFGKCYSFRNRRGGNQIFVMFVLIDKEHGAYRRMTWEQVKEHLQRCWTPFGHDDIVWKQRYIND